MAMILGRRVRAKLQFPKIPVAGTPITIIITDGSSMA